MLAKATPVELTVPDAVSCHANAGPLQLLVDVAVHPTSSPCRMCPPTVSLQAAPICTGLTAGQGARPRSWGRCPDRLAADLPQYLGVSKRAARLRPVRKKLSLRHCKQTGHGFTPSAQSDFNQLRCGEGNAGQSHPGN